MNQERIDQSVHRGCPGNGLGQHFHIAWTPFPYALFLVGEKKTAGTIRPLAAAVRGRRTKSSEEDRTVTSPTEQDAPAADLETLEVALFPIPDVVAFPGMVVPLHVFEPRYRQLVHDCVEDERLVAVSHTLKTIHEPSRIQQSTEEALRSNQATYKPQQVFSAGRCQILETMPDGRLLATVTMTHRLALIKDIQSLPYRIVLCAVLKDRDQLSWNDKTRALQGMIHERLYELVAAENEDLAAELQQSDWLALDPETYSYSIFQVLRFPADIMQYLLEIDSVTGRLEALANLLDAN